MPGIVGLVTKLPREVAEPQLRLMVEALQHDSEYTSGTWIDEALGVYVGWAARKGSFSDGMPIFNERRDAILIFSGEEFPEPGVVSSLRMRGHEVEANGPSYLIHVYEEDSAFPAALNGRFHGFVIDRRRGTATLFNDRYGMHQVLYHECPDGFYFAAEAKAILAVRPELRTVDARSLGELISCNCVLENRTLFKGIYVLPHAAAWGFKEGAVDNRNKYFQQREWEEQPSLEPAPYYREVQRIFSERLPRYFDGPEPIGMSLTGGLDTRMIMAWQRLPPGKLPCYTFGGMYRDCRDVSVARRVASICGQPHNVITVGGEFLSRFGDYAERTIYLTDGSADVSRSVALFANEKARETAPVRMAGVYGSEILRRLRGFKPSEPTADVFQPELLSHIRAVRGTYSGLAKMNPVSFTAFSPTPQRAVDLLEQSQVGVRFPFLDNEIVRLSFRAPNSANSQAINDDVCLKLIADGHPALGRIRTDRGLGGTPAWTRGAARAFLEFTFKCEYAYDYGMPHFVARLDRAMSLFHPERVFLGRHKFSHFRIWYRDVLAGYVREILLDRRTLSRPYLERSGVERIVSHHLKGDRNYTTEIHRLLTLELTHRLLVDAK